MFWQLLAQASAGTELPQPAAPPQSLWTGLLAVWWLVPLFIIMYVLLIAPQRKKEKKRVQMLQQLKKNDKVVTIGGVHGVVKSLTDDEVVVLADESKDLKLRMSRWAIREIKESSGEGELGEKTD